MTVPRASVLLGLTIKSEPAGMSELGESLGMSPRNMTVLVDGLEKEGLVRRVSHQHDRRVKLVELTEAGRRVAEQELGPSQKAAASLFDDFTPEERDELLRLLEKVADSLRARGIELPPTAKADPRSLRGPQDVDAERRTPAGEPPPREPHRN
ncbi:MarR family winged helix-turn-helix transcriptional regulator [Streptomyces millisiae]|uniref:MarR family winged helix-turn-helix transcriptional regulator n=1 Tax=Streptomyces millisiae TaxID=3075542 RepID=A0ABU2LUA7_9ACTN|nr:MarR family winged helix-turn-helix transcriptional regulator [Streptomyces sp. DSM 44918]MDT0321182.1 MarR family winged helix-turn-helix transcriptional regulator [Streptomyces sp. DSM 44918]